ncbi:hypothetical protein BG011_004357 [Mortierella polycephala]|uniref:Uncharacterized protein n=1 Tax=Mortierella polycephala TaxID=41804 RepID=A0A9P6Q0A7_9FUNG|nr:hypothetical protein BG011_004357 [Mortierella polycephala]
MPQLFESTRNYLKTTTKLGRRMSLYKDETSGSEASFHGINNAENIHPNDTLVNPSHAPMHQNRLSNLFSMDGRARTTKHEPGNMAMPDEGRRRNSKSSERTHRSNKSSSKQFRNGSSHQSWDQDHTSVHMENENPRGQSPTLSLSNTVSTAASSYDTRPSDYASMRHYQAHVWRRNLLEESIMHSLKLGYADRQRSTSRHHSLSKKDSPRARRTREQAILAAAMGSGLASCPESEVSSIDPMATQENIIDRSLNTISNNHMNRTLAGMQAPQQQHQNQQKKRLYQQDYNASMTNITESFTSFTLELPEHQVSHIMASSMVPHLFKVKGTKACALERRPRSRRSSRSTLGGGITPSPRVLSGKRTVTHPLIPSRRAPREEDKDEVEKEDINENETPISPTTTMSANSTITTLSEPKGFEKKETTTTEEQVNALQVSSS